ncbi:MAG: beta strand repeat-containing protein [Polynucleobacter sp.]
MKLLNFKNVTLTLFLLTGCVLSISTKAQTCSGSVISIGSGQSCNYLSNTTSPSSGTTVNSVITSVTNAGTLGSSGYGIYSLTSTGLGVSNASSTVSIGTITNLGLMDGAGGAGTAGYGILSWAVPGTGTGNTLVASIGSIVNAGTISTGSKAAGVGISLNGSTSTLGSLVNASSGTISGNYYGIDIQAATITSISNSGTISADTVNPHMGIHNNGTIGNLTNSGSGLISGYIGIQNGGTINSLTNTASITGPDYGIVNYDTITTLNNGQGAGNTNGPLTFYQNLPTNYNIIINSKTSYGQLAVNGVSGSTTFGIYGGGVAGVAASTLNKGTYSSVLSGVLAGNLNNTKGNYNGFTWSLNNSSGTIWDLIVTGASTADTQQSLVNTASALQNTFTLQNTVLANSFSYDCNVFGANNVCVSAGGRNTQVSAANGLNNTSALLIAAYRVMPSVRIGAYADQNLSVNNAGSTVNLGNNTPLIGLFGAWNERLDGTGTEVKVSAAYGQKNTTVNRQIVGTSEAGSGSSQLNSQGAQVAAKYGFAIAENTIVSPYVGVRYTQNNMNGYSEQATSSVTAPLTYSALNTNATTALAGVGAQYKFIPQATVFASAGVETDTNTSNGTYSATGITGLTPINFNANPVKTRPTATVGAYYDVEKNQRVGITGIYRQEPYQAVQATTVMATYTVGL